MKSVIVIGAGGAGLVSALSAKENGAEVVVITKEYPTRSQTCMAQGGINGVLYDEHGDSIEMHIQNTLKSANGLADEKMVRYMCKEAPNAIRWLDNIGVPFSRGENSNIAQRKLGGAFAPRACYAQDYTGLKILHTLYDQCLKAGVVFLNERFLLDFIIDKQTNGDSFVCGVSVLNKRSGEVEVYESGSVIVATGGYSRIFGNNSTNSTSSTGDGLMAALRAGVKLNNLEFIQFHPTALKKSSILISESARGCGGYLLNSKKERFVDELAPRDEVSRAIYDELKNGGEVFLDIRHIGDVALKELPQEIKLAKLYEEIDPLLEPIPIKPAAHYTMGGIEVDENCATSINGLYAVGECANHRVHGANRLGGNSLLELVVFGKIAGKNAANFTSELHVEFEVSKQKTIFTNRLDEIKEFTNEINFYEKQSGLGSEFYRHVGIKREKHELEALLESVKNLKNSLDKMGVADKSKECNTNLVEFLEFQNMLTLSELVLICAINRDESRGAHFRADFLNSDNEKYRKHTAINESGVVTYED